jgi:hypothetical protein
MLQRALAEVEELLDDFEIYFIGRGWTPEEMALELEEIAATLPHGTVRKKIFERLDMLTVGDNMLH